MMTDFELNRNTRPPYDLRTRERGNSPTLAEVPQLSQSRIGTQRKGIRMDRIGGSCCSVCLDV